ncbi:hypothetical protein RRG08_051717 [Elysia crispata]|uniref:Uncharacterized protein n=1 Tax=Elysia crispata TaxID=231223 RepID=A0AAE1BCX0_9GAST|nr:hypothetical protein RRG08_051717 [Elysia crispata]
MNISCIWVSDIRRVMVGGASGCFRNVQVSQTAMPWNPLEKSQEFYVAKSRSRVRSIEPGCRYKTAQFLTVSKECVCWREGRGGAAVEFKLQEDRAALSAAIHGLDPAGELHLAEGFTWMLGMWLLHPAEGFTWMLGLWLLHPAEGFTWMLGLWLLHPAEGFTWMLGLWVELAVVWAVY